MTNAAPLLKVVEPVILNDCGDIINGSLLDVSLPSIVTSPVVPSTPKFVLLIPPLAVISPVSSTWKLLFTSIPTMELIIPLGATVNRSVDPSLSIIPSVSGDSVMYAPVVGLCITLSVYSVLSASAVDEKNTKKNANKNNINHLLFTLKIRLLPTFLINVFLLLSLIRFIY